MIGTLMGLNPRTAIWIRDVCMPLVSDPFILGHQEGGTLKGPCVAAADVETMSTVHKALGSPRS